MSSGLLFFCPLCRKKSSKEIGELVCGIEHTVRLCKRGELVALQGDRVSHLYMLIKGRVKTEIIPDSGLPLLVEKIKAPYPLAAAFLFADDNRFPVEVTAVENCELILISKAEVERQMSRCPEFAQGFMAFIANRTRFLSERLKIFSQKGIKAKLAFYILNRSDNGSFDLGQSITSLAEYFGVERPSLSRCISELVRQGTISYEAGKGKILRQNALKELLD